jgi:hypothetical protein
MPTIEELFKSKKLANGKTAAEHYDVRNSKDLPITPYNPLLGLSFKGATVLRKKFGNRLEETLIEEETSGLRVISDASFPIIYGTDTFRLANKTTEVLNVMKAGSNNAEYTPPKIATAGVNLLKQLGVKLPQDLIPSRVVLDKSFKEGKEYNTMDTLLGIKASGTGNASGKFLKTNFTGTPDVKKLVGNTIQNLKSAFNSILLQSPSQAAVNFAVGGDGKYDSTSPYSKVMIGAQYLPEDMVDMRYDLSSKYTIYEGPELGSEEFVNFPQIKNKNTSPVPNVFKAPKSKYSSNKVYISNASDISTKLGIDTNNGDKLNTVSTYEVKPNGVQASLKAGDTPLDDYDFVPLKFWSVYKNTAVNFRAIISGLTETLSPSWDTNKFIGNPFNFYTYNSIERSVNFTFKIYSLNNSEHIAAWQRLNFLTSLVYPQGYIGGLGVAPPFIRFTLGDMFRNKEAFVESLTYTIDDNSPWDIGVDAATKDFKLPMIIDVQISLKLIEALSTTYIPATYKKDKDGAVIKTKDSKGNDISVQDTPAGFKRLYAYGDAPTPGLPNKSDTANNVNADGSAVGQNNTTPLATNTVGPNSINMADAIKHLDSIVPKNSPHGIFVAEYKGYKIYEVMDGNNRTLSTWDGDSLFHGGNTNTNSREVKLQREKDVIDGKYPANSNSNTNSAKSSDNSTNFSVPTALLKPTSFAPKLYDPSKGFGGGLLNLNPPAAINNNAPWKSRNGG